MSVPVTMTLSGKQINVSVAASKVRRPRSGEIWICSVSKAIPISIGRGENRGREVIYHNVVRNWLKVGDWNGTAGNWTVPMENIARDGVDAAVVYVQDGNRDKPGAMLGAAYTVAALKFALRHSGASAAIARHPYSRSWLRFRLRQGRIPESTRVAGDAIARNPQR